MLRKPELSEVYYPTEGYYMITYAHSIMAYVLLCVSLKHLLMGSGTFDACRGLKL